MGPLCLIAVLAAGLGAFAPFGVPAAAQGGREEVLVSAASSLGDVLPAIARAFEATDPARITLNLAASNALVRQVQAGAPVDVFISANDAQIAALGLLARAGPRIELASNQLVIVVPDDRPSAWPSARALLEPTVRRVAIGDPAGVPVGVYAKAYLEQIGLWAALQSKLVPTGSARLALAAVETGAVDAAVVYRTDAALGKRSRVAWRVPGGDGPPIRYTAVRLRDARHPAAAGRFVRFLGTGAAQDVLRQAGFCPPRQIGAAWGDCR